MVNFKSTLVILIENLKLANKMVLQDDDGSANGGRGIF